MARVDYSRSVRPKWSGTAGISFQRAGAQDEHGSVKVVDMHSGPLSFSMPVAKIESVYTESGEIDSSQVSDQHSYWQGKYICTPSDVPGRLESFRTPKNNSSAALKIHDTSGGRIRPIAEVYSEVDDGIDYHAALEEFHLH